MIFDACAKVYCFNTTLGTVSFGRTFDVSLLKTSFKGLLIIDIAYYFGAFLVHSEHNNRKRVCSDCESECYIYIYI